MDTINWDREVSFSKKRVKRFQKEINILSFEAPVNCYQLQYLVTVENANLYIVSLE